MKWRNLAIDVAATIFFGAIATTCDWTVRRELEKRAKQKKSEPKRKKGKRKRA